MLNNNVIKNKTNKSKKELRPIGTMVFQKDNYTFANVNKDVFEVISPLISNKFIVITCKLKQFPAFATKFCENIYFGIKVYLTPKAFKKRHDFIKLMGSREEKLITKCFRNLFWHIELILSHEC